ncbi:50S ribosomal protein L12 [Mycobacterium sp. CBMA293]|uniref:ribosomal protein L7/L12 n=1 Tax=unclassified Mycolicibacterium TaxID=2636767 RepID=UPI0012DCF248|nr:MULTISPECIES: ribosomal protein L7/L12 [unclassified Mycolicibacterium]MUL46705.1 50S ribosomal protein L12 [Mycolicibacterium sp. CBMA 360]MUL58994.1 50S ribosomal protein L12 [Mycolicibacterium sp. CBMA 335]MUL69388.1 50S ribosomal protein L12 [Mycolicibacterium sp. CBMA 311]MUL94352.1 50S ribosomal protein L12 [Mycolicibacterium sp. CBMA 230]MUM06632.1 hypothetical protein [Mycolicibacterium sp. CBMA 213]
MALFGRSGELSYDDLLNRLTELERRVAVLERAAGGHDAAPAPQPRRQSYGGPGVSPEVMRLAADGQKITAIKLLREQTGLGLKEAKDIVDRL